MNKSVILFLIITFSANLHFACNSETTSELKRDDSQIHNDFARQAASIELNCPRDALVFLIGSSEEASRIEEWNIDSPSKAKVEEDGHLAAKKFQAAIEKAKSDLTTAFAQDPKCQGSFELVFASIIDGPDSLDSSIETTHYGSVAKEGSTTLKWKMSGTKSWSLSGNRLVPHAEAFELNMATATSKITQILAKNSFQSIANSKKLESGSAIVPAQIHYVLKTHGARIATDAAYQPTLENIREFPRLALSASHWQSGILMDTHGPSANSTSSVFSAHWSPADVQAAQLQSTAGEGPSDTAADGITNTAGDGETKHNTSGDGNGDTAGEYGMTSGSKSLAFQDALIKGSEKTYLGKRILGSFAAYADLKETSQDIGAAAHISFPVGNTQNVGKNMIILDSCYASEKILNALEYTPGVAGKTVVLASVNELYFEFFDYSKLDLAGFLKMPVLLEKLKTNNSLSESEKELLVNMSKGRLAWGNDDIKSDFKKMSIWID